MSAHIDNKNSVFSILYIMQAADQTVISPGYIGFSLYK